MKEQIGQEVIKHEGTIWNRIADETNRGTKYADGNGHVIWIVGQTFGFVNNGKLVTRHKNFNCAAAMVTDPFKGHTHRVSASAEIMGLSTMKMHAEIKKRRAILSPKREKGKTINHYQRRSLKRIAKELGIAI